MILLRPSLWVSTGVIHSILHRSEEAKFGMTKIPLTQIGICLDEESKIVIWWKGFKGNEEDDKVVMGTYGNENIFTHQFGGCTLLTHFPQTIPGRPQGKWRVRVSRYSG